MNRLRLAAAAVLFIAGCNSSAPPAAGTADPAKQSLGAKNVTLYVPGMNQRLQIL